jgi:hypothetical protein
VGEVLLDPLEGILGKAALMPAKNMLTLHAGVAKDEGFSLARFA